MSEPFNFNKLDRPGRPSNQEICAGFRELITHGFYIEDEEGEPHTSGDQHERGLRATKAWRNDLWRAFREIEDRLCPMEAMRREKE